MKRDVRRNILDAALALVEQQGLRSLTQPRVARKAGVRQSHLTYYFPRKLDLTLALLQDFLDRASETVSQLAQDGREPLDVAIHELVTDRARMRFFLGLIDQALDEPQIMEILRAHMRELPVMAARAFGRDPADPAIEALVDQLRGLGLRALVFPGAAKRFRPRAAAARLGLEPTETAPAPPT